MIINKVSYKNEIMEIHYSVLKDGGKEDFYTIRSGDQPLPSFRNLLLKLRSAVVDILEFPNNDEEVKRISVNQVSFDYSGENDVMGAVISAKRKLNHSGTNMALNTPHKFAKKAKGESSSVFDKPVISLLEDVQEECIKYVNGERVQGDLFKDSKVEVTVTAEVKPEKKAAKSKIKEAAEGFNEALKEAKKDLPRSKKKTHFLPTGPEIFAIKAKGKYLSVSANAAAKLTALISESGVLQESIHDDMKEVGYAGNKILFEVDGGLLQIHSAVSNYKQINNDNLAKNVIEELIDDFLDQPVLRLKPGEQVALSLVGGASANA
jgi:hypothetical protein